MPRCVVAVRGDTVCVTQRRCRHALYKTPRPILRVPVCLATLARPSIESSSGSGMSDRDFPLLFPAHRFCPRLLIQDRG